MMKREELSRIASVKLKKAVTAAKQAVSPRVLAFCVMVVCLVATLGVTAANLRLTYVTDSNGARQVLLTDADASPAQVMHLSGIRSEEGDEVYYTAFSGNLASLNIERAFSVSRTVAALSISVSQSNTMLSSGKKNEHRITGWNPLRADHKTAPAQAASAHAVPYAGRLFTSSR